VKKVLISYFEKAEPMPGDVAGLDGFGVFGEMKYAVLPEADMVKALDCPNHEGVHVLCYDLPEQFAEAPALREALETIYPALINAAPPETPEGQQLHVDAVNCIRKALHIEVAEPMEGGQ
jgi:hypothetical protein